MHYNIGIILVFFGAIICCYGQTLYMNGYTCEFSDSKCNINTWQAQLDSDNGISITGDNFAMTVQIPPNQLAWFNTTGEACNDATYNWSNNILTVNGWSSGSCTMQDQDSCVKTCTYNMVKYALNHCAQYFYIYDYVTSYGWMMQNEWYENEWNYYFCISGSNLVKSNLLKVIM